MGGSGATLLWFKNLGVTKLGVMEARRLMWRRNGSIPYLAISKVSVLLAAATHPVLIERLVVIHPLSKDDLPKRFIDINYF